jgi:hypothetical protein
MLMAIPVISMATEKIEPNNDFNHATLLKEATSGSVGYNDAKDVYKFFVAKNIEMRIDLKADNDVDLFLYNPDMKGVAYSCEEFYEDISYKADMTGYWYVEVTSVKGDAKYTLTTTLLVDQNDGGYDGDAGNSILKAGRYILFPMEPADDTPGRGRTGTLDPSGRDTEDWYRFSACDKQTISITITPTQDYDLGLYDDKAIAVGFSNNTGTSSEGVSHEATYTGDYYMRIFAKEDAEQGTYTMNINLQGHNDADQNSDAGNTMGQAMTITPGTYSGFMSYYDQVDWYDFSASSGQGIQISLEVPKYSDYNLWLYDPDDILVNEATYYGDDLLEYTADKSGTWKLKIDMFPGYDSKWDEYPIPVFKYGSGAYELALDIGVDVSPPPVIPQPEIVPVAQTLIVNNEASTNKDEYSYMAAVSASNYLDGNTRCISPIIYEGDDTVTNWFGTVDDTTEYLLEDWNNYLANHNTEATAYTLNGDPVTAAAELAERMWGSSADAVLAVDGSLVEDEVTEVLSSSATLDIQTSVKQARGDSDQFREFEGNLVYPFFVGNNWGVMNVALTETQGSNYEAEVITPNYMASATDWWPEGVDKDDIWQPIMFPGIYGIVSDDRGDFLATATMYSCDRYKIPVENSESTLRVTIETDEPSYLWVYLIDPRGNVVAPDMPSWSGAEVPPFRIMPGNHSLHNEEEFDHLVVEAHTTFTAEVSYPLPGTYTAIVVPRKEMSGSISYSITGELQEHGDRVAYALSAANGAVAASLTHKPLLYTAVDSIPDETIDALNKLGVTDITFIDLAGNDIVANELTANYNVKRVTTMAEVTETIKSLKRDTNAVSQDGDDYLTITSFASDDGYYAPSAYIAAYHGSPVADIGAMGEAYHWGNVANQWMFYAGDYYHGTRSIGHLPMAAQPVMDYIRNGEIPPIGWDAELEWYSRVAESVYTYADSIGMDRSGVEAYCFVAPKTDIDFTVHHTLLGNESTAGQFIGKTSGESAAYVSRSALYPAIIFGNPDRNLTTSSLINFMDGEGEYWPTNDGVQRRDYIARYLTKYFNGFGREYKGHCIWDNLVVDQNKGTSLYYYSGHGTGGGGVSYHPLWAGIQMDSFHGYEYWDSNYLSPRMFEGQRTWYNVEPPEQYDLIHFKWCDQLWENFHNTFVYWMSCTTFAHYGPEIYLEHGSVASIGNANTGSSPLWEIHDQTFFTEALWEGKSIGHALSENYWLFDRDVTTMDPTSIYGSFSMHIDSVQVIYGDPMLYIYSPRHWVEPEPVDSAL